MARPNWEFIRVDVLLDEHPKLDGLTDAAKWTLVTLWLHCGKHRTDGFVRDAVWQKKGTAPQRRSIVAAGLAERGDGGWWMHDYLEHQRSLAEIEALSASRSASGQRGGIATAAARAKQALQQTPQHLPQQVLKQTRSKRGSKNAAEAVAVAVAEAEHPVAEVVNSNVEGNSAVPRKPESDIAASSNSPPGGAATPRPAMPECECGAVLDPDGTCFACGPRAVLR